MTKRDLEQYDALTGEIKMHDERVKRLTRLLGQQPIVSDAVQASMTEIPYAKHTIHVCGDAGYEDVIRANLHMQIKLERAYALRALRERSREQRRILSFIGSIQDSELRQIFTYRYIHAADSWEQVALKMGEGFTGDAVRKRHDRYLAKV